MKERLLVFHSIIAPYRVDFFNGLSEKFETRVCLFLHNLPDQTFDYDRILAQLAFAPVFMDGKSIEEQIGEFDPDIVLVPEVGLATVRTLIYRKLHRRSFRVISMVDDSYNMMVGGNQYSLKHVLAEKLLFPHLNEIVVVDPRVQEKLQDDYGKGILFPIIQSEDSSATRYADCCGEADRLVREHGLQGCRVLLSVCRLVALKNLDSSITAFKRTTDPNYRYVIVGSGPEESRLRELAKDDPRIIFTGRKEGSDLYAWYLVADSLILPSTQEAFGAVTDEALLAGCWCMVSSRAGSSTLIEEGRNGNIFDPTDIDSIHSIIDSSLSVAGGVTVPVHVRKSSRPVTFDRCFDDLTESISGQRKPRVLFIMHMPPPVHGAAVVGEMIRDSKVVSDAFDCRYINLAVASNLTDIGKLGFRKIVNVFKLIREAGRTAKEFAPDMIYFTANTVGMPFYKDFLVKQSLRHSARRIVLHFHNKGVSTRQDRPLDNFLYRRFFKGTKVILLDRRLYGDIQKYVQESDVRYCPNGIEDCDVHEQSMGEGSRILFLSNMMAAKGVWVLLEACRILKEHGESFRCDFVGGWKDISEEAFESKLSELGLGDCVKAYGPKYGTEKDELLGKADFMVFPTLDECFGLVLLEAMLHGLACVASDEGAIPSVVKDGETGLIVPKNDPKALADAMERLLKDTELCCRMGRSGRKRYEEMFTKERFERTFCNTLNELL